MNKLLFIILAFIFVNGSFAMMGFIAPTLPIDKIAPIQLWINASILFALFLPSNVGEFLRNN